MNQELKPSPKAVEIAELHLKAIHGAPTEKDAKDYLADAIQEGIEEGLKRSLPVEMEKLDISDGDTLVFRGRWTQEQVYILRRSLMARKKKVTVICLPPEASLKDLSPDRMRTLGWITVENARDMGKALVKKVLGISKEEIGQVMHESWEKTKRERGFHGPKEPCEQCERVEVNSGGLEDSLKCHFLHADLVAWEYLPEKQKDINRNAFDDVLAVLKRRAEEFGG